MQMLCIKLTATWLYFYSLVDFSKHIKNLGQKLFPSNSGVIFKAGILVNELYCACFLKLFPV